jgi:hypothetical protein
MMPWAEMVVCEDPDCPDHGVTVRRLGGEVYDVPELRSRQPVSGGYRGRRKAARQAQRKARKRR